MMSNLRFCVLASLMFVLSQAVFAAHEGSAKDQDFVNDLVVGNMTEVRLGELAQKNGMSQDVKSFGSKMVTDHGKANTDLLQIANKKGFTAPKEIDAKHQKVVDKFSGLNGDAFDKAYINDMIEDHEKDVKMVKDAIPKLSDPDLKTFANGVLTVMEGHLSHVKALKK